MIINDKSRLEGDQISQLECPKNKQKFASGLPDTIVIHYTAGSSAESSARELINPDVKASAHIVIGREGEIIQLVPFDVIAWHAGKSFYGGRDGLNKYSIGIEIDNAGPLEKVGSEYKSWFGRKYQENDVLYAAHRNNPKKSYWHLYTDKQIEACQQVCIELIKKYSINTIVGHEEIAPTRKTDPGPAFPLDRFREHLLSQNRSDEPDNIDAEGMVASDLLNIRKGAGINFKKVAQPLRKGTPVLVLEEQDGWYEVETKITGWVSKAHIQLENE